MRIFIPKCRTHNEIQWNISCNKLCNLLSALFFSNLQRKNNHLCVYKRCVNNFSSSQPICLFSLLHTDHCWCGFFLLFCLVSPNEEWAFNQLTTSLAVFLHLLQLPCPPYIIYLFVSYSSPACPSFYFALLVPQKWLYSCTINRFSGCVFASWFTGICTALLVCTRSSFFLAEE